MHQQNPTAAGKSVQEQIALLRAALATRSSTTSSNPPLSASSAPRPPARTAAKTATISGTTTVAIKPSVQDQIALLKDALKNKNNSSFQRAFRPEPRPEKHRSFANKSLVINPSLSGLPLASKNKSLGVNKEAVPPNYVKNKQGNQIVLKGAGKQSAQQTRGYKVFKGGITKDFRNVAPATPVITKTPAGKNQLLINGTRFRLTPHGNKLIRVTDPATTSTPRTATSTTPKQVHFAGKTYTLTKRGNLISRAAAAASQPCKWYPLGKCKQGIRCPYTHDPTTRHLCRAWLRGTCTRGDTCRLAHVPRAETTPACLHFRRGACGKGAQCRYLHAAPVRVLKKDARVCAAFAREGYCARGLACEERHMWRCPEVDRGEVCALGDTCKLAPCWQIRKGLPVKAGRTGMELEEGFDGGEDEEEVDEKTIKAMKPDFAAGRRLRAEKAAAEARRRELEEAYKDDEDDYVGMGDSSTDEEDVDDPEEMEEVGGEDMIRFDDFDMVSSDAEADDDEDEAEERMDEEHDQDQD